MIIYSSLSIIVTKFRKPSLTGLKKYDKIKVLKDYYRDYYTKK